MVSAMKIFFSYDPLTASFIIGNPELKRITIDNYDLRFEWFMDMGEIIGISACYKYFDNPISCRYLPSSNTEIMFINAASTQVYMALSWSLENIWFLFHLL